MPARHGVSVTLATSSVLTLMLGAIGHYANLELASAELAGPEAEHG